MINIPDVESIEFRGGFKYQLTKTYSIQTDVRPTTSITTQFIDLDITGLLTTRRGYAWDGPSGPTIDTLSAMRASLVHDALYQLMRMGLIDQSWRHAADELFYRICLEDGMWSIRAKYFYAGVDVFAAGAATTEARKKIIIAPKPRSANDSSRRSSRRRARSQRGR